MEMPMTRRDILRLAAAGAGAISGTTIVDAAAGDANAPRTAPTTLPDFEWGCSSISELRKALQSGRGTAVSLTQAFLDRIAAIDKNGPTLNAVIELNPDALAIGGDRWTATWPADLDQG
jgi:amidase